MLAESEAKHLVASGNNASVGQWFHKSRGAHIIPPKCKKYPPYTYSIGLWFSHFIKKSDYKWPTEDQTLLDVKANCFCKWAHGHQIMRRLFDQSAHCFIT